MTYLTNTSFLTGGIEIEGHNGTRNYRSIDRWQEELNNAGFDFVQVKSDASPNVDFELVFPPMPLHMAGGSMDDIAAVLQFVENSGGKVSKRGCGLHIHVGLKGIVGNNNIDEVCSFLSRLSMSVFNYQFPLFGSCGMRRERNSHVIRLWSSYSCRQSCC